MAAALHEWHGGLHRSTPHCNSAQLGEDLAKETPHTIVSAGLPIFISSSSILAFYFSFPLRLRGLSSLFQVFSASSQLPQTASLLPSTQVSNTSIIDHLGLECRTIWSFGP